MRLLAFAFGAVVLGLFLLMVVLFLTGRREFQRARRRRPFHWEHADPSPNSLSTPGDFPAPSSDAGGHSGGHHGGFDGGGGHSH